MNRTIKARFTRGVLELLEEVELKEGDEVTIFISSLPSNEDAITALKSTAGSWKGTHGPRGAQEAYLCRSVGCHQARTQTVKYLLDTDWVIDYLHDLQPVVRRVDDLASGGLALSILSVAELYEGVYYSTDPSGNETALKTFVTGVSVLGLDEEICQVSPGKGGGCGGRAD